MKFNIPRSDSMFEIPDEWWQAGGMTGYTPRSSLYCAVTSCSTVVPIADIEPPRRDEGTAWFRDRNTVVQLLHRMRDGTELPPILVWSKERKCSTRHVVRDGFHRFYLSVAIGYSEIPIEIQDFDLDEFLSNEANGHTCAT